MTAESHSANRGSIPRRSIRLGRSTGLAHGRPAEFRAEFGQPTGPAEENALSERSESKGFASTASNPPAHFYIYILRCSDGSLYVGHTADLSTRFKAHCEGKGASWTARRRPVTLLYHEPADSEAAAVRRERQVKGWTHAKKLALINGDLAQLKKLAVRRSS